MKRCYNDICSLGRVKVIEAKQFKWRPGGNKLNEKVTEVGFVYDASWTDTLNRNKDKPTTPTEQRKKLKEEKNSKGSCLGSTKWQVSKPKDIPHAHAPEHHAKRQAFEAARWWSGERVLSGYCLYCLSFRACSPMLTCFRKNNKLTKSLSQGSHWYCEIQKSERQSELTQITEFFQNYNKFIPNVSQWKLQTDNL